MTAAASVLYALYPLSFGGSKAVFCCAVGIVGILSSATVSGRSDGELTTLVMVMAGFWVEKVSD